MRMSQKEVPEAPCREEIPRRATSEEVSKPRPKRIPRGYIFQGLDMSAPCLSLAFWFLVGGGRGEGKYRSMNVNARFKTLNSGPPPTHGSGARSSPCSIILLSCTTNFHRMYIFRMDKMMRNEADTEVPIIPPTFEKEPKRSETAAAVAATTMDVMITILVCVSC